MEVKMPYVEDFLNHLKVYQDASEYTIKNYPIHLRKFFEFTGGKYNVNARTIKNFTMHLLEEKKEARATINARLSALRSYFHFLYNEEIISSEIGNKIEFVKKESKKAKKIMPQKQIIKILDSVEDVRDRAVLETLYATGVREGELSKLDIEHIDFENRIIVVFGKGKKTRAVPISNTALKWIKANIGSRKKGPLFLNNRNGRLGERSVYNIVKAYFPFSPHELRHAFATHMITKTGNIKAISEMLGHSSTQMTEQFYTHMTSEYLQDVYKNGGMDRD